VLRVARTLADLDRNEGVEAGHIGEALRYRPAVPEAAVA
jgi:predicted ATPase with chaperone activity